MNLKEHFSIALGTESDQLCFTAHSHHLWPDVTRAAHMAAWDLAASQRDDKWGHVFGEVLPACQEHICRLLELGDPAAIAFAPNTHELIVRLFSCFPRSRPTRVLTTDGEFHSFRRQLYRYEEADQAVTKYVPVSPRATFSERFRSALSEGEWDVVYLSQVFFETGFVVDGLDEIVASVPDERTFVVIDGYHGFMARETDLSAIQSRAFYISGGYKYAMSGEGACFMHCPPRYAERPVDTGWYAGFTTFAGQGSSSHVSYDADGARMWGATFDPTPFFRFRAVMDLWQSLGVEPGDFHAHSCRLQDQFLSLLEADGIEILGPHNHLAADPPDRRANFLTFATPIAERVKDALHSKRILTDYRGDKLRFGFGPYHDEGDVEELALRIRKLDRSGRLASSATAQ